MKYRISKKYNWEMAHKLTRCYSEACKGIHGHSYVLEVVLESINLNDDGMVMDFGELDNIVKPIVKFFDHSYLEEGALVEYNPTAENMCLHILNRISEKTNLVYCVRLWETAKCKAEVFK